MSKNELISALIVACLLGMGGFITTQFTLDLREMRAQAIEDRRLVNATHERIMERLSELSTDMTVLKGEVEEFSTAAD